MQGHEFEKKVQQQMGGLQLPPSDAVWSNVENSIRKDKRRRRVLFLLPILLLLGTGSAWILFKQKTADKLTHQTSTSAITPDPAIDSQNKSANQPSNDKQSTAAPDSNPDLSPTETSRPDSDHKRDLSSVPDKELKLEQSIKTKELRDRKLAQTEDRKLEQTEDRKLTAIAGTSEKKSFRTRSRKPARKNFLASSSTQQKDIQTQNKNKTVEAVKVEDLTDVTTETVSSEESIPPATVSASAPQTVATDSSMAKLNDSLNSAIKEQIAVVTPTAKKSTTPVKSTWQFGVNAGVGVSRISEAGIFQAFNTTRVMDAGYATGSWNLPVRPPAKVNPGLSWNAGLFIQRKLTRNLSISSGLNYQYYSTTSEVGSKVDSTATISNAFSTVKVEAVYRSNGSGDLVKYRSAYHFIELPVNMHLQLSKGKKAPLFLTAGLSIGRLISTSALHYDGRSDFYYEDDQLFRKTQLGVQAGFSVRLFNKTAHPFEIGPQFGYRFSNLLISGDTKHLLNGTIGARWTIRK